MSGESAPTVFLVDDDASVRKALGRLLRSAGYVVRTFGSAEAFLEADRTVQGSACVLLDVRMPGLHGQAVHQLIRASDPTLPVVFVTGHGDITMGVEAMKAGAVDFLPKPVSADRLFAVVEQALARAERERRLHTRTRRIRQRLATLTPREREVLDLVVRGRLNKEIASALGIVEQTVKVHRARLMRKMHAPSLADLVRDCEQVGVPEVPHPPGRAGAPA